MTFLCRISLVTEEHGSKLRKKMNQKSNFKIVYTTLHRYTDGKNKKRRIQHRNPLFKKKKEKKRRKKAL